MPRARVLTGFALLLVSGWAYAGRSLTAQRTAPIDSSIFRDMIWRPLGPSRPGRTTALAARPSSPDVFYEGVEGAGLWATDDSGVSWRPIFSAPPHGSVAAIGVSPSEPDVLYAGTGLAGDTSATRGGSGLYRSTDTGVSWTRTALDTTAPIAAIVVAPRDANRVWAVIADEVDRLRHWRVVRSVDGGRTFTTVLDRSGVEAIRLAGGGDDGALYAVVSNDAGASPRSVVLRSRDDGASWQQVLAASEDLTTIAAESRARRLYAAAVSDAVLGIYRSDNDGDTWQRTDGPTAASSADRVSLSIDPSNPDRLWLAAGGLWASDDGGRTWQAPQTRPQVSDAAFVARGAGGRVLAVAGVGASVTTTGGRSWSSPLSQATDAIAHIAADESFPYRICGTEPSGAAICLSSQPQGDAHDWEILPVTPPAAVLPDPANADYVYTSAFERFDRRTGHVDSLWPSAAVPDGRAALAFTPDGQTLYAGDASLWTLSAFSQAWTRLPFDARAADAAARISAIAISPVNPRVIWIGTTTGDVAVSRDGGAAWTHHAAGSAASIARIEPSHFDPNSVYVVRTSPADGASLVRTRDGGATWTPIAAGIPATDVVLVVREDPLRRGLLFAGTDRSFFISFDDGAAWQPWALNLPPGPVPDLLIRDATLVAATGGRGIWAIDDIAPLRELTADIARADAFLFRPVPVWRTNGTMAPGAVFSYMLGPNVKGPVRLEVIETAASDVIRRFDLVPDGQTSPGLHRIAWDLRYTPPTPDDRGPLVLPGTYQVRLTVGDRTLRQALVVRPDPRVRTPAADLAAQLALARAIDARIVTLHQRRASLTSDADRRDVDRAIVRLRDLVRRIEAADGRPGQNLAAAAAAAIADPAASSAPR